MPEPSPAVSVEKTATPARLRLFIGSSLESLEVAQAAEERLARDVKIRTWENIFNVGEIGINSLLQTLQTCDFALFVVTGDDSTKLRGSEVWTPRDNGVFETGLAYGQLGAGRVFLLKPQSLSVHLPSDLLGVNHVVFNDEEFHEDQLDSLATAVGPLR